MSENQPDEIQPETPFDIAPTVYVSYSGHVDAFTITANVTSGTASATYSVDGIGTLADDVAQARADAVSGALLMLDALTGDQS